MGTVEEDNITRLAANTFGKEFAARIMRIERDFAGVGDLFILEAVRENPTRWARQCYVVKNGENEKFYESPEELLIWFGSKKQQAALPRNIDPTTIISGAIALIITLVLSYIIAFKNMDPPSVLSNRAGLKNLD